MECKSKGGCAMESILEERYPRCKADNPNLFYDVCQHYLIMSDVAKRVNVPIEELVEFFYKGRLKINLIEEQEEVLRENEQGDAFLREVSQNDGPK